MKYLIWSSVISLVILHQDYWQWGDATLDFGFLPRGLTFHVCISIGSAVVWLFATKYCWPEELDEVSEDAKARDARA